jgi:hypothetical protein
METPYDKITEKQMEEIQEYKDASQRYDSIPDCWVRLINNNRLNKEK